MYFSSTHIEEKYEVLNFENSIFWVQFRRNAKETLNLKTAYLSIFLNSIQISDYIYNSNRITWYITEKQVTSIITLATEQAKSKDGKKSCISFTFSIIN